MTLKELLAKITGIESEAKAKDTKIAALEAELANIKTLISGQQGKAETSEEEEDTEAEPAPAPPDPAEDENDDEEAEKEDADDEPASVSGAIARLIAENKVLKAQVSGKGVTKRINAEAARLIASNGFDRPLDTVKGGKSGKQARTITRAEFNAMSQSDRSAFFKAGGKISKD